MKNILNDRSKAEKIYVGRNKNLNNLIHVKNRITDAIRTFRNKTENRNDQYNDLNPSGSRPVIMYGLAKVHKIVTDNLPSFRPIFSVIATHCKI